MGKLIRVRNNKECSKPGIYKIENYTNDKIYVGSSVNMSNRIFNQHLRSLKKGTHHSYRLQDHYNKYGEDDFFFTVIDVVPRLIRSNTEKQFGVRLKEREQYYIDTLKPEFNISKRAFGGFEIGKPHSEEHKKHLRENHADFSGENHPNFGVGWNLGKKYKKEGGYKIYTIEEKRIYQREQYRKKHNTFKEPIKTPFIKKTKEELAQSDKEYRDNHKEQYKEYQKNYRESHKNKE